MDIRTRWASNCELTRGRLRVLGYPHKVDEVGKPQDDIAMQNSPEQLASSCPDGRKMRSGVGGSEPYQFNAAFVFRY